MFFRVRTYPQIGLLALTLALSACGGGGSSGTSTAAPAGSSEPKASLQATIGTSSKSPVRAGTSTTFYVASITAAEGAVTTTWDFGDGSPLSNVDTVQHIYAAPGTYTVTLRAADAAGKTTSKTAAVVVEANASPDTPTISYYPSNPEPGQTVTLIGSGTDKYGDTLQFTWSLPNGQTLYGPQQTVAFNGPGFAVVELTVTDTLGATATVQKTITIAASSGAPAAPAPNRSWTQNYDWSQGYLYDLNFLDAQTGFAPATIVSSDRSSTTPTLLKTTDAGAHWSSIDTGKTSSPIVGVRFLSANEGWIVGSGESRTYRVADGWIMDFNWGMLMHTTDGGSTWSNVSLGTLGIIDGTLRRIAFTDSQHGWAVGSNAMILSTSDGGATWTKQDPNVGQDKGFSFVQFVSSQAGWVAGTGGQVLRTTNGGTTWTPVRLTGLDDGGNDPISYVTGMSFIDANNGWVSVQPRIGASDIYRTADGGVNWSKVAAPDGQLIGGLLFTNTATGYAIGATGDLYKTTDGGQTWSAFVAGNVSMQGMAGLTLSASTTIWTLGTVGRAINYGGIFSAPLN